MPKVEIVTTTHSWGERIVEIHVDNLPLIDGRTGRVWQLDSRRATRLQDAREMDAEIQRICMFLKREEYDGKDVGESSGRRAHWDGDPADPQANWLRFRRGVEG